MLIQCERTIPADFHLNESVHFHTLGRRYTILVYKYMQLFVN